MNINRYENMLSEINRKREEKENMEKKEIIDNNINNNEIQDINQNEVINDIIKENENNDINKTEKINDNIIIDEDNNFTQNEEKKELNDGPKDNENGNKTEDIQKTMDEYYEELLKKKEFRLLTDSQYVTLENRIGENACYINVIIHFLYIFPCVNDYLIKKYK